MERALEAKSPAELDLETIFQMRESWWRYHLARWTADPDPILKDLSERLINRRLFKTVRVNLAEPIQDILADANKAAEACGFDPRYYVHQVRTADVNRADSHQALTVLLENDKEQSLAEADPLIGAMTGEANEGLRSWIVLPQEAKQKLGRSR